MFTTWKQICEHSTPDVFFAVLTHSNHTAIIIIQAPLAKIYLRGTKGGKKIDIPKKIIYKVFKDA